MARLNVWEHRALRVAVPASQAGTRGVGAGPVSPREPAHPSTDRADRPVRQRPTLREHRRLPAHSMIRAVDDEQGLPTTGSKDATCRRGARASCPAGRRPHPDEEKAPCVARRSCGGPCRWDRICPNHEPHTTSGPPRAVGSIAPRPTRSRPRARTRSRTRPCTKPPRTRAHRPCATIMVAVIGAAIAFRGMA